MDRSVCLAVLLLGVSAAGCSAPMDGPLEGTEAVAGHGIFEINLELSEGADIMWVWNGSGPIDFDVHSHFDGEVQVYHETTSSGDAGEFTAHRTGGFSLFWKNPGPETVTVEYRVTGPLHVHSYVPDR